MRLSANRPESCVGVWRAPNGPHRNSVEALLKGNVMELGLAGKVAVVTGSSRGIGRGIALALPAEGCDIVVTARDQKALEEATSYGMHSFERAMKNYILQLQPVPETKSRLGAGAGLPR